jgi:hypothetical protein
MLRGLSIRTSLFGDSFEEIAQFPSNGIEASRFFDETEEIQIASSTLGT